MAGRRLNLTSEKKPKIFYGYVVVASGFSVLAIIQGTFASFGVFFNPLITEFGWSRAMLSGANALGFFTMGSMAILIGMLLDKLGPRKVMIAFAPLFCLGHLLLSQVNALWQIYLFYIVIGIGFSVSDVVPLSTVVRWFVKKRSMMSGITKVGTGLGMMVMPLVANGLINAFGWRNAYIILGILVLVTVLPLARLLRRDPAEIGELPDGEQLLANQSPRLEEGLSLREALRTWQFWLVCCMYLVIMFFAQTMVVHVVPYALDIGASATQAAGVAAVVGGVSMLGRIVLGFAGDRIGNKRALIVCFLIMITALSWLQLSGEVWRLYLFAVIYGFSHGGFFALLSPTVAGLFGTLHQGSLLGFVIFCFTIGGSIGPILTGAIFDITGSYHLAFMLLLALAISGLVLATLLKPVKGQAVISSLG